MKGKKYKEKPRKMTKREMIDLILEVDVTGFTVGELCANVDWCAARGYNLTDVASFYLINREWTKRELEEHLGFIKQTRSNI